MDTQLIAKGLHISGLTPSISVADLSRRLSAFANVKELDGFGKLDTLGQPRKFGCVTLEGTKGQLAKCEYYTSCERLLSNVLMEGINVWSGSIWKGTKLRVGYAKPDYQERSV